MLQVTEYIERRNTLMQLVGKRAIHKETGRLCTILYVQEFEENGCRYTVHFDHQPKQLKQVLWGDCLVLMGGVQAHGSLS